MRVNSLENWHYRLNLISDPRFRRTNELSPLANRSRFVVAFFLEGLLKINFLPARPERRQFSVDFTTIAVFRMTNAGRKDERDASPIQDRNRNRKFCLLFHQLHISDSECLYLFALRPSHGTMAERRRRTENRISWAQNPLNHYSRFLSSLCEAHFERLPGTR